MSPNQAPVARFEIRLAPAGSAVSFDATPPPTPTARSVATTGTSATATCSPTAVRASRTSTPAPAPTRPGSWSPTTRVRPPHGVHGQLSARQRRPERRGRAPGGGPRRCGGRPAAPPPPPDKRRGRTSARRSSSSRPADACAFAFPAGVVSRGSRPCARVPVGSLVDTTRGRVLLSSARAAAAASSRAASSTVSSWCVSAGPTATSPSSCCAASYGPCRARRGPLLAGEAAAPLGQRQGAASGHAGAIRRAPCAGRAGS